MRPEDGGASESFLPWPSAHWRDPRPQCNEGKSAEQGSPKRKRGAPRAAEINAPEGCKGCVVGLLQSTYSDLCRGSTYRRGTRRPFPMNGKNSQNTDSSDGNYIIER